MLLLAMYLRILAATGFGCCILAAMTALPNMVSELGLLARKAMQAVAVADLVRVPGARTPRS